MSNGKPNRISATALIGAFLLLCSIATPSLQAAPGPVVQPPYTLSVFAPSTAAYREPDSIVQWHDRIFVGFSNGVAKDGTDGKSSTIVEYSLDGTVKRTFSVPGHNDGLRIIGEDDLWSLQNEDSNPNLVVIELPSGSQKKYTFAPTAHGGGFDDMRVIDGKVIMTASNPALNGAGFNVFPSLVIAKLHGNMVEVTPILGGQPNAINIATGTATILNLTDPDSLTIDPRGNVLLDDQGDGVLLFIRHPFSSHPDLGYLNVTLGGKMTTVDDTAFVPSARSFMLVTDLGDGTLANPGTIYRIDSLPFGFEPGTAYSASDTNGVVGTLNLDNGVLTPIVTGLFSGRGVLFVAPDGDHDGDDQ
jgi:hypothetical protein